MSRITSFLLLAFGFAWGVAGIGYLCGIHSTADNGYVPLAATCMFGPAVAALVQHRLIDRAPWPGLDLHPKLIRWKFMWLTVIAGICIVPAYFVVIALFGNGADVEHFGHVSITSERFNTAVTGLLAKAGRGEPPSALADLLERIPAWLILVVAQLSAVFAAFTLNLPFMLGEELGWRGYLYQRTASWSVPRRVLFTGTVWGLWHAPLIAMGHNYPGYPVAGIFMMVVFCVSLAFLFDWTRTRSGSVWSACILHGLVNGTAGGAMLFAWNGHVLVGSIAGAAGCMALLLILLVVLALDRQYRMTLFRSNTFAVH
ncbi:MAG: CPBP family intramembrane glutamic endopeptidase [Flavobacteriales bacterium]